MKVRFFNPGLTYQKDRADYLSEIDRVLKAGDLILRADVEAFEARLANYVGTKYAVALNSGTDALYLALKAIGIGPGDEVAVPSRTFVATAQVVKQVGAEPVYYDIDGTINLTEKMKAIMVVHIEGEIQADMEEVLAIAKHRGIHVIEDAAQALGASQNGIPAGSFGIAGCFSFYPAKILGAFGDAGGLTTNDEEVYKYVRDGRNHFKEDARDWGINSRMDNLQAAILNIRFLHLPGILLRRAEIARQYHVGLQNIGDLKLPPQSRERVWQDYIVQTPRRDGLFNFLKGQGIETLKNNYPFPVPKLPGAQKYEDETLRLPCNENITDEEVQYIINNIKEYFI